MKKIILSFFLLFVGLIGFSQENAEPTNQFVLQVNAIKNQSDSESIAKLFLSKKGIHTCEIDFKKQEIKVTTATWLSVEALKTLLIQHYTYPVEIMSYTLTEKK